MGETSALLAEVRMSEPLIIWKEEIGPVIVAAPDVIFVPMVPEILFAAWSEEILLSEVAVRSLILNVLERKFLNSAVIQNILKNIEISPCK